MARVLQAFNSFPIDYEYFNDWMMLSSDFASLVGHDPNFLKLLHSNKVISDTWEELKIDIYDEIEDELRVITYTNTYDKAENLYETMIQIAEQTLISKLFRSLIDLKIDFINTDIFFEDSLTDRDIDVTSGIIEKEGVDPVLAEELRQLDNIFKKFKLNSDFLLRFLNSWKPPVWEKGIVIDKKILKPPLIKKVEFFDPNVYKLIKQNPDLLNTLDWRVFEEMLADMLKTFGYVIELTKKTKDGGIDVIALKGDNDFGQHKYILQAKRFSKAVQVSPIRELMFLHNEQGATKSCLATTSTFTKGAKELGEKYRWRLELKDKEGILKWIDKVSAIKNH